jgi:hypothetical protein
MARSLLMLKKEIQMGTNSKGPPKASCLDTVSPGDGQIFPSGAPPHTRARLHVPPITAKHAPPPSDARFSSINKIPTNHSETNNFCPHEYEQELCRGRTGCILAGALTALWPPHLTQPIIIHPLPASHCLLFNSSASAAMASSLTNQWFLCSSASGLKKIHWDWGLFGSMVNF